MNDSPIVRLHAADAATLHICRGRKVEGTVSLGPNQVHAVIFHGQRRGKWIPGDIEDLGISNNVLITSSAGGRDQIAALIGGLVATGGQGSPATGTNATNFTATATPWTTNLLAGMRVVFPITNATTTPVFGNIISNTSSVATVDGWWTPAEPSVIGTTPGTTNAFIILPGGSPTRYMALTENASAASASDTALTGEIASGGLTRAQATYAHTLATGTFTLIKAFSVTGTFPAVHKMGIFNSGSGTAGSMMFESVLNADANVISGDTLTVTETVTIS